MMVGEMVNWFCAGTGAPVCPGQYVGEVPVALLPVELWGDSDCVRRVIGPLSCP